MNQLSRYRYNNKSGIQADIQIQVTTLFNYWYNRCIYWAIYHITKNFILSSFFFLWPSYLIAKTISVWLLNVLSRELLNKTWWCSLWITASSFVSCFFLHLDVLTHSFLSHSFHLIPFTCISLVFSFSLSLMCCLRWSTHTHTYRHQKQHGWLNWACS